MKVFGVGRNSSTPPLSGLPGVVIVTAQQHRHAIMNAPREFVRINVHLKIFSLVCVSFHSSEMTAIGSSVPSAALMK